MFRAHLIATFAVVLVIASDTTRAELLPQEVAILAVKDSRESQALAKYYAQQRNVPLSQICLIDVPRGETVSREVWQQNVRPAIRAWIDANNLQDKIRCFVTVWDVPLRIDKDESAADMQPRLQFFNTERERRLRTLAQLVEQSEALAGGSETSSESDAAPATSAVDSVSDSELQQLTKRLELAVGKIQRDVQAESNPEKKKRAALSLRRLISRATGLSTFYEGLARNLRDNQSTASPQIRAEFDFTRGRITGINEGRALIELQQLPSVNRDQTSLLFIERIGGLIQAIRWLDEQMQFVQKNETDASFDSELSLVLWPEYDLLRWQNNFLHRRFDGAGIRESHPTLMVSRLDAPTLKLAKGLVDAALQTEAEGLDGKVYLDGRGLAQLDGQPVQPGSFEAYDRSLLLTAAELEANGRLTVVSDTKPELFQPGMCPDAALYCGWYSLAKYVDAFDWKRGAVGYHLASLEAKTLKTAESEVWCKRMIEDGICATLGPVAEPYLNSFPPPNEFFPLLMSGEYSLVECYYRTKPYNSWMMTLIGDPLYNPFKNKPAYEGPVEGDE